MEPNALATDVSEAERVAAEFDLLAIGASA